MTIQSSTARFAASKTAKPASNAQNAGGPSAGVSSFSKVLGLKLGMGLTAGLPVAQLSTPVAQPSPAESAPQADTQADPNTDAPNESLAADANAETESAEDTQAAADEPAAEERLPAQVKAKVAQATSEVEAKVTTTSPDRPAPEAAATPTPSQTARDTTQAAAHAAPAAQLAPAKPAPAENAPAAVQAAAPEAAERQAVDTTSLTRSFAPRSRTQARDTKTPQVQDGAAPATDVKAAEVPPASEARDPLGLIRTPVQDPADRAQRHAEQPALKDQPEQPRVRFSDLADRGIAQAAPQSTQNAAANQAQNAAAVAAGAIAVGPVQPGATPAPTGKAPVAVSGVAAVAGTSSSGGAGVGSGGAGAGGMGGGSGDLSSLLNGRALGVSLISGRAAASGAASRETSEAVQAQIARGMAAALRQKGGVMTIRLNPEHLGSMRIDLTVENGSVSALFGAESEDARRILQDGLDSLKRSIEETGLKVQKLEISGVTPQTADRAHDRPTDQRPAQDPRDHQQNGSSRHNAHQNPGHNSGEHPSDRRASRDTASDPDAARAETAALAADVGRIWAEADGSAQGLLRLRVDAVV